MLNIQMLLHNLQNPGQGDPLDGVSPQLVQQRRALFPQSINARIEFAADDIVIVHVTPLSLEQIVLAADRQRVVDVVGPLIGSAGGNDRRAKVMLLGRQLAPMRFELEV